LNAPATSSADVARDAQYIRQLVPAGTDTAPYPRREPEYPERVSIDRDLEWDGCFNVRDLGGLH
jgi:hypothetical protein